MAIPSDAFSTVSLHFKQQSKWWQVKATIWLSLIRQRCFPRFCSPRRLLQPQKECLLCCKHYRYCSSTFSRWWNPAKQALYYFAARSWVHSLNCCLPKKINSVYLLLHQYAKCSSSLVELVCKQTNNRENTVLSWCETFCIWVSVGQKRYFHVESMR